MENKYRNMRCSRCNGIVSQEISEITSTTPYMFGSNQVMHTKCSAKSKQEENVCFVLISFSEEPLEEAVEVIPLNRN